MLSKANTEIQSILLSKDKFTLKQAKDWITKHNFKLIHRNKGVDETEEYYRFRQKDPGSKKYREFRTDIIGNKNNGIRFIYGILKYSPKL